MKHIINFLMSHKKYSIILLIIIFAGIILFEIIPQKTIVLDDVSLQEKVSSSKTFAIYIDDGTADTDNGESINYVEYDGDTFPAKADGYKYNSEMSVCVDNSGNTTENVTLYYNNDMIQVNTSETVYCYIYFDLYSKDGDYCLVNDITSYLGECALVMDNYSNTVEQAKENIEEKGEATTSAISPTITFGRSVSTSQTVSVSTTGYFVVAEDFSFSTTTGIYTLKTTSSPSVLTDDYIGYYTCGSTSTTCTTMYKIISYTVSGTTTITQKITEADKYTYSTNDSIESENGIYMTYDDDGETYYYRGNVKNNYVYFAGYYWRIIRINGDGSVRMIYAGTSADATGTNAQIGTSQFNTSYSDPTYVGYKYGTTSSTPVTQSNAVNYTNFQANTTYYFGTSYEEVGNGTFKLSDGLISGTFSELFGDGGTYEDAITDYYTCFSTSSTGTCTFLRKLNAYNSSTSANVYYISYASTSYEDTLTNENDSTIKTVVDNWYEENILDKYDDSNEHLLSEYISTSAIFCGDRSLYSTFAGAGYILTTSTYYGANRRINTYSPSLYCSSNSSDWYSVDNGNLDYPIGLITADEASFAGGRVSNVNTLYYLYTGSTYWTMSPSSFDSARGNASVWGVYSTGDLGHHIVTNSYGVRPVINLSSEVLISQGTGTASNPFVVTLTEGDN